MVAHYFLFERDMIEITYSSYERKISVFAFPIELLNALKSKNSALLEECIAFSRSTDLGMVMEYVKR